MASTIELEKAERVRDAENLAAARSNGAEQPPLRRFIALLYEHVPPADVAQRSPDDLCCAALALWQFASHREPGRAKVRVYNPTIETDGWSSTRTIVEIVNDDMPFLVDSVTAAVNEGGREVRLVIHPILNVARDAKGTLLGLDPPKSGLRESWMQIEITREPDPTERAAIASKLETVLADVQRRIGLAAAATTPADDRRELSATPPPLPPSEIAEGLISCAGSTTTITPISDSRISLRRQRGYRRPARHPRDPIYPVLKECGISRRCRDVQDFCGAAAPRHRQDKPAAMVHRNVLMDAVGIRRFGPGGEVVGIRLFAGLFTSLAYTAARARSRCCSQGAAHDGALRPVARQP